MLTSPFEAFAWGALKSARERERITPFLPLLLRKVLCVLAKPLSLSICARQVRWFVHFFFRCWPCPRSIRGGAVITEFMRR